MTKILTFKGNDKYSNFTDDQKEAAEGIIKFFKAPFEDGKFIISLAGSGGTGKTYLTNYLINNSGYASSVILCAAPTHKACRNLSKAIGGKKVITIQSVFGFRLDCDIENFDPNNPNFAPKSSPKITNMHKILLIDEASMLNRALVKYIINFCRKCKIKVLFIGDDKQLAAPKDIEISAFKMSSKVFHLNQIVRQEESSPIKDLLAIVREDIDNKTFNFLTYLQKHPENFNASNSGYRFMSMQDAAKLIKFKFEDEDFRKDITLYKVIAYKNVRVTSWNTYIRKIVVKDSEISALTIDDLLMSYVTLVDEFNSVIFANSEEYIVKDIVDTVDPVFQFRGFLVRFQQIFSGDITSPLFIINHKDPYTWQMYTKVVFTMVQEAKSAADYKRSALWKEYFDFKKKYLSLVPIVANGTTFIDRDVDYGFAITSHKSQGSTYGTVFVDLKDMIYDKNNHPFTNRDDVLRRIYVACSRASKQLYLIW